jgi:hypothetical protein
LPEDHSFIIIIGWCFRSARSFAGRALGPATTAATTTAAKTSHPSSPPQKTPNPQHQNTKTTKNKQAQDPRILGAGNANLPRLAAAIATALGHGVEFCGEAAAPRLVALLGAARASCEADVVRAAEALPPKKREMFQLLVANGGRLPA